MARAESEAREWLLLFDQDTSPTLEFLLELLDVAATVHRQGVEAIVPKFLVNGIVYSPATHFIDVLRQQFLPPNPNTYDSLQGIQEHGLTFTTQRRRSEFQLCGQSALFQRNFGSIIWTTPFFTPSL